MTILKEFVDSVAQELALIESHNIWRDDIAPLISNSRENYLSHAIIAVTMMHRTRLEGRVTFDAAMHYHHALHDVRVALNTLEINQCREMDPILSTLLLLTWFEVSRFDLVIFGHI